MGTRLLEPHCEDSYCTVHIPEEAFPVQDRHRDISMLFMCLTGVVHLWAAAAYIKSNPQGITTLAFSSTLAGKPAGLALKAPAPSFRSKYVMLLLFDTCLRLLPSILDSNAYVLTHAAKTWFPYHVEHHTARMSYVRCSRRRV